MHFEYPLLEALAAVVREGTFEAAARSLSITQSAVSQRVKLLEERVGAVLVVRGRPCIATEYGQQLCRHLDQVQLMEQDLRRNLASIENASSEAPALIRVAVNRDSLATWFPEVIQYAGSKLNLHFDIIPDDQEHTADRLRSGEALAAITAEAEPLQGCRRFPLGAIEYLAVATETFKAETFNGDLSIESLSRATCLIFDRKDTLPQQWITNAFGRSARMAGHWLPSFSGYLTCCLASVGWGMMPRFSIERHLKDGSLVELMPGTSVIVPLYWQSMTPSSGIMKALSAAVAHIAQKHLLSSLLPASGQAQ